MGNWDWEIVQLLRFLPPKTGDPSATSRTHDTMLDVVVCVCNPSVDEEETEQPLKPLVVSLVALGEL